VTIKGLLESSAVFAIRAMWIALIVVPASWILIETLSKVFSLSGPESTAAAAWTQGIGSILAIIGAGIFPYWHQSRVESRKADRLRSIVLMLARNQQEHLRLLHSTLYNAQEDFGHKTISPYVENEWPMKWPAHTEALRAIPIADLDAGQVYMVNELKVGADYAWRICKDLESWNVLGDRERSVIVRLNHYWEMARLTVALLDKGHEPISSAR